MSSQNYLAFYLVTVHQICADNVKTRLKKESRKKWFDMTELRSTVSIFCSHQNAVSWKNVQGCIKSDLYSKKVITGSIGFDSLCKIWPFLNSHHEANLWLNLLTMQSCSWGQYVCFKKNFIDVQRPAFTCTSDPIMCGVLVHLKINNRP